MNSTRWAWLLVLALAAGCGGTKGNADGGTSGSHDAGTGGSSGTTGASPAPTNINPTSGPTDGGTAVVITGSGFASGAAVKIGSVPLTGVLVVSPQEIHGVTGAGPAGQADVIVINPDTRTGKLSHGFTYVAPSTGPSISWCNTQFPLDPTGVAGDSLDLYGQVYAQGVTDSAGQGAGIQMQAGITGADGGLVWVDAAFNTDQGNNDEYVLHTTFPAPPGTYLAAFRAQLNNGGWTYCEKDGPHASYDATQADVITSTPPAQASIGWCNLQFPTSFTVAPGDSFTLYGRVYAQGITDQAGQGAGIAMQAGLGYPDGGWSWSDATYNTDVASNPGAADINNDEYQWASTAPGEGTYATAFRASLDDAGWSYCEVDGLHAALDPTQTGTMTSKVPAPPTVGWCNTQFPIDPSGVTSSPLDLYGQVFVQGVTEAAGQGAGVVMQAGFVLTDGGVGWTDAAYNTDANANDEYVLHTSFPATAGTSLALFRAQVGGGDWTYCEKDGPHATLDLTQADVVTANAPTAGSISWCNLQFPASVTVAPGDAFTLYGRVYVPGVTDAAGQGAGVSMQAGLGYQDGGWLWSDASYNTDVASSPGASDINNDEYLWASAGPSAGTYATAFRAALDDGGWSYCELDGIHGALDPSQTGTLTSAVPPPPKVDWCELTYPQQATGAPGAAISLFGQVYEPGVTDSAGQGANITMEAGIGWADGGWTWTSASYDADKNNGANDEYQWNGTLPTDPGTYLTAYRAMITGGPWTYCLTDGPYDQIDVTRAGSLTVNIAAPPTVSWCNFQYLTAQTAQPGDSLTAYGRVYAPGVTDQAGQGPGITMDLGIGTEDGGITWVPATYNGDVPSYPGKTDINNDEYLVTFNAPAVGNYGLLFRASLDGGPYSYCETEGPQAAPGPIEAEPLVVGDTVSWCDLHFPSQVTLNVGSSGDFYGWVYQPGVTDAVGQGAGIEEELGYGPGDGGWSWSGAAYNGDKDGINVGDHANDEYRATIAAPAAGSYYTVYRSRLNGGPWLYCQPDGPHLGIQLGTAGTMTVQ